MEKKREERVTEFAPVYEKPARPAPVYSNTAKEERSLTEDSIAAGLAFFKQKTYEKRETVESDDEELLPPGEGAFDRPTSSRGAAIPPPTSMDYYAQTKRTVMSGKKVDVRESFSVGLKNQREGK